MAAAPSALVRALEDRYTLERELGSGGMATVYLARDRRNGSVVAIKVLRPELAPILGPERFAREIRITSRLQHPNILPVLSSGEADGVPFYVTPYIEGDSLATRLLREGQLPIPDTIDIACQIANALEAAHSQGFVHRDIKPSNILLENGRAILADFGIARAVDVVTAEKLTESGIALGTPAYMSPEQSACGSVDARSDIYSLGCVLFEMLCGSPPFVGPSAQSVRARHALDPPPSLRTVRNTVSPALERVIEKALAKVPADRFPSAAALAASLTAEPLPEQSASLKSRRRSARLAIALGSVAVIAGGVVFRPGPGPSPPTGVGVVIAPFDLIGDSLLNAGSSAHRLFAEAVEWVPGLHALDGSTLLGAGGSFRSIPLVDLLRGAQELGGGYLITGAVLPNSEGSRVTVDLYSVDRGERLVRGADTAMGPRFDDAVGRLAVHSARAIAERENLDLGARRAIFSSTSSAAALGQLIQGQAAFSSGDYEGAAAAFARAIEADSTCGLAYMRLSGVQSWHHEHSAALETLEAGLRLRHRLTPRWVSLLEARRYFTLGEAERAITTFQTAVLEDRQDVDAWLGLGESLFHLATYSGQSPLEAQGALERVTELDSAFFPIHDHLVDLALLRGDSSRAVRHLRGMPAGDAARLAREQAILLRFGHESARSAALSRLREVDRQALSGLVVLWSLGAGNLPLVDTIASFLTESGRTPDDRRRGGQYRLVALAGQGNWAAGLAAWRQEAEGQPFDAWLASAHLAGYPTAGIADSMFAWARGQVNRGAVPDFTLPPWDEQQQGFQALVHRATLEGDSSEVLDLLRRMSTAKPATDLSDPIAGSLRSSLEARLALLASDSAVAIESLRGSLARINHRFTWYYPLTSMAPQRRLLSEILQARGAVVEARRWRESFRKSWSIGDVLFAVQPQPEDARLP